MFIFSVRTIFWYRKFWDCLFVPTYYVLNIKCKPIFQAVNKLKMNQENKI